MTTTAPETAAAPTESADAGDLDGLAIAVVIPCLNEEIAIAGVVEDFRRALPRADIYVYDNNSSDGTAAAAARAGAIVRPEAEPGKGNVVRRAFSDIDADVYVLVDGDATYPAAEAPGMIRQLIDDHLDMVSGARVAEQQEAYRRGHRFGNELITTLVGLTFGRRFTDILTGYRVMSRRFVKSFPALSKGFEIETEITVHALEMRLPSAERPIPYFERPEGSSSKLRTVRHGISIFKTILVLIKEERPLEFFTCAFALLEIVSILLALPVVVEYLETGLVPRFPTAILATGLALLGFMSLACGLILDTVTHSRQEIKRLHYLSLPGLPGRRRDKAQGDGPDPGP
ncbi:MAG: glycosyltransferase family 2 protein [Alphaproteobacteria bacterium]|nr:glycosyltransferase family 2 protein [Alphaproteobacteria bacterium]